MSQLSQRVSADMPAPHAGRWPPSKSSPADLNIIDCKAIESAVRLTPPALIDKLCKGQPLPPIDSDAIFVEELLEIARKLGRMHLVTIIKGDP
jgi:hypothetical protein